MGRSVATPRHGLTRARPPRLPDASRSDASRLTRQEIATIRSSASGIRRVCRPGWSGRSSGAPISC